MVVIFVKVIVTLGTTIVITCLQDQINLATTLV
jgi:hypothetical protein